MSRSLYHNRCMNKIKIERMKEIIEQHMNEDEKECLECKINKEAHSITLSKHQNLEQCTHELA